MSGLLCGISVDVVKVISSRSINYHLPLSSNWAAVVRSSYDGAHHDSYLLRFRLRKTLYDH